MKDIYWKFLTCKIPIVLKKENLLNCYHRLSYATLLTFLALGLESIFYFNCLIICGFQLRTQNSSDKIYYSFYYPPHTFLDCSDCSQCFGYRFYVDVKKDLHLFLPILYEPSVSMSQRQVQGLLGIKKLELFAMFFLNAFCLQIR